MNFINREIESDSPGIQYVVVTHDSTLWNYVGGFASISPARPLQESTTMMIYSMTKTITAAAILQLVDDGKISLDDPISKYLADIPYTSEITIRHLLSQTSGIPNPVPLKWVHLVEEHSNFDDHLALQSILKQYPELKFTPGMKCAYSNISYWLLGEIIKKISGIRYEDYVRQNIFRRLQIPDSEIDFLIPVEENHSKGYLPRWSLMNLLKSFVIDKKFIGEYEDKWLRTNDHYLNGPAFGGVVASAEAISIFLRDMLSDHSRLFSAKTKQLFFEQQKSNDGKKIEMTLGWHMGNFNGIQYFYKEGGGGGFHSEMRIYPKQRTASVVISNNTSYDVKKFLNIADKEFIR